VWSVGRLGPRPSAGVLSWLRQDLALVGDGQDAPAGGDPPCAQLQASVGIDLRNSSACKEGGGIRT
jgi:hypothetical protein